MSNNNKWAVSISQYSKNSGIFFNTFSFTVCGVNKEEAVANAMKELQYWSDQAPIHVDQTEQMKLQNRGIHKLTWKNARNIVTSVRQIK